jgi:hypothetical protein
MDNFSVRQVINAEITLDVLQCNALLCSAKEECKDLAVTKMLTMPNKIF